VGETWIGVTGFYATDNPQPGLAVARALRQADPSWRIVALVYDAWGTGAFAHEAIDAHALVPYPAAGPRPLLRALRALRRRHPLDVLIPTVDAELAHYVALRPALRALGIRTRLPGAAALRARDKRRLPALGRRAGIAVPETTVLGSAEAVARASTQRPFPQLLKGALVDSVVVHSPEDFRVAAGELAAQWGYPLLAQPLVAGEEYDVAGVARRGELLGAAVMKKLGVTGKGTAWAGVTVEHPEFVERLRRLVRVLVWDGAIEAEFIATADGAAYCFEINPRFPSWIALAADAGANLPAALVRLALGEDVEPLRARPGRLFARALLERVLPGNPLTRLEPGVVHHDLLNPPARRPPRPAVPAAPGAARPGPTPARRRAGDARPGAVAVTGLNAADNPSPGLTVARALRALPAPPRLVGLTHEVLATGAYVAGVWDEVRLVPYPSREEGGYPDALVAACRAAGVDCLLPTLDIEVPVVTWLAPRLAAAGIATLLPAPAALERVAKPRLPALAAEGFRVPRTRTLGGVHELPEALREVGRPLVLKGPLADARVVHTDEQALVVARRLAATWGFPLLAQEYIPGEEFGIAGVADRAHRVVGTVVVRKEIRSANGNTWGGSSVRDRGLERLAARFAARLAWVGPFELEVIRHPQRGPVLIEVNPRFPAWIYLAAGAGANLPWAAVRLARGERVAPGAAHPGAFYVRLAWDATAAIERMGALAVEGRVSGHVA
jgi:carbamoyl-phosphate synthase large subunit